MASSFVGIDTGSKGAIVILDDQGRLVDCLAHHGGVAVLIANFLRPHAGQIALAASEKAGFNPHNGKKAARAAGLGEGVIYGILAALQIHLREVASSAWQDACGIVKPAKPARAKKAGDEGGQTTRLHQQAVNAYRQELKRRTMEQALKRWPTLPVRIKADWDLCDAAYLAEYARLAHAGLERPTARVGA